MRRMLWTDFSAGFEVLVVLYEVCSGDACSQRLVARMMKSGGYNLEYIAQISSTQVCSLYGTTRGVFTLPRPETTVLVGWAICSNN